MNNRHLIVESAVKPGPGFIEITPEIAKGVFNIINDPKELDEWVLSLLSAIDRELKGR